MSAWWIYENKRKVAFQQALPLVRRAIEMTQGTDAPVLLQLCNELEKGHWLGFPSGMEDRLRQEVDAWSTWGELIAFPGPGNFKLIEDEMPARCKYRRLARQEAAEAVWGLRCLMVGRTADRINPETGFHMACRCARQAMTFFKKAV